jgi:cytochrome c oxidase cbb3-type subunit 3
MRSRDRSRRPSSALAALAALLPAILLLAACEREARRFETPGIRPEQNAYEVSQGKRLFSWYDCNGCHATGGGGNIGPPLSDPGWRYGSDFDAVMASIRDGRPNGMPGFGGRIPDSQIRQIAAYVRSLSGQLHSDVAPSRADRMTTGEPESRRDRELPVTEPPPGTKK